MQKITAIIPTFNESIHIREAIKSVSWADEIIVVDSFSTDGTQEIVKKEFPQVKLLIHEYINSAAQKNWTIPQASHPWIFLLDADERPTPELVNEIKNILKDGTSHAAFWINRTNYFMEKKLNFTWRNDAVIRLFKRDECKYEEKHVHAEILAKGTISRLKNRLSHDTYTGKGLEFHLKKGDRYTTWGAYDRLASTKTVTMYHLAIKPLFAFVKHYFVKLGFLDGKQGFIIAILTTWNVFIRAVKIWRIQKGEKFKT
jgi:glycosyltransferase involved in cell wall biosynthesis